MSLCLYELQNVNGCIVNVSTVRGIGLSASLCFSLFTQPCGKWCGLGSISVAVCLSRLASDCCSVSPGVCYFLSDGTRVTCHQPSLIQITLQRIFADMSLLHHVKMSLSYIPKSRLANHRIMYILICLYLKGFLLSTVRLLSAYQH